MHLFYKLSTFSWLVQFDMEVKKYAYLDGECKVPLTEDKVIEGDMTLYIGYSNSSAEDVYL